MIINDFRAKKVAVTTYEEIGNNLHMYISSHMNHEINVVIKCRLPVPASELQCQTLDTPPTPRKNLLPVKSTSELAEGNPENGMIPVEE